MVHKLSKVGERMVRLGGDISHYQTVKNWDDLKEWDFVFMKATDGDNFVDSKLSENIKGALGVGLSIGFYHFLRDNVGIKEQADFLVKTLKDHGVDFEKLEGIVLDDEVDGAHFTQPEMAAAVQAFRAEIKALTGKDILLYSSYSFLLNEIGHVDLPIWLADYTSDEQHVKELQAKGFNVKYVQYTDQGHVAGIDGNVDLDKDIEPKPAPTPPKPKVMVPSTYVVKAGDTLSEICAHYEVKMDDVVKWSHVTEPNKIYPGQILHLTQPNVNQVKPKLDVKEYEVISSGETLTHIALVHGTTIDALMKLNPQITNRNNIYAGQKIRIR